MKLPTMTSGYAEKAANKYDHNRETVIVGNSEIEKAVFQQFETIDGRNYCRFKIGKTYFWQLAVNCGHSKVTMFDDSHVVDGRLSADRSELRSNPPAWMERGLQQTASGFGSKLNSGLDIYFEGKFRRVYVTCFSNCGMSWFNFRGQKIVVR